MKFAQRVTLHYFLHLTGHNLQIHHNACWLLQFFMKVPNTYLKHKFQSINKSSLGGKNFMCNVMCLRFGRSLQK